MVAVIHEQEKSEIKRWWERELDERKHMIGGIDNMGLLLSDAVDFNPVC